MRTLLVLSALLCLASPSAFASRATVSVIGTGDAGLILGSGGGGSGSFFYDDANNLFYNPSYVNDFRGYGVIEKSNFPGVTAQGGFYTTFVVINAGVYLNRGDAVLAPFANRHQMRPIEISVGSGSEMGLKWGLTFQHAGFNGTGAGNPNVTPPTTATFSDATENTLRLGMQVAGFEPFVSWTINSSETVASVETKQNGLVFGTRYRFGEWIPYAAARWDRRNGATARSAYLAGLGRGVRVGEGAKVYYALALARDAANDVTRLPIEIAAEAEATSWLALRAGLGFRAVDRAGGNTTPDSTTARVGASLHLGKAADFDWAFGRGTAAGLESSTAMDGQVFDVIGVFTAASLTYRY